MERKETEDTQWTVVLTVSSSTLQLHVVFILLSETNVKTTFELLNFTQNHFSSTKISTEMTEQPDMSEHNSQINVQPMQGHDLRLPLV